jgi:hypothetical protein
MLTISGKALGRKKPLFADWSIPFPPDVGEGGDHVTLRDLITRIVRGEVEAFKKRQNQQRLVHALTAREIDASAAKGKVDMGGQDLEQSVNEDTVIGAALQAFEDGLYLVILDGEEQRELDREVYLQPDSRITFVRLVMLAGG